MRRLLLCLPVLLFLAPSLPHLPSLAQAPERREDDKAPLPDAAEMKRLAKDNPVAFLRACLRTYDHNVQGYSTTLQKQERLDGKLQLPEVIEARFREQPYSVYLHWLQGARLAEAALYVEGENDGKMLVRPALAFARSFIVERDPEGEQARRSSRYTMKEFGLRAGTERTLIGWQAAAKKGELHVEYLGEKRVKEAGDRPCLVLHRFDFAKPEEDGITDLTIYVDRENWLQVGSVLKGEEGKVIAAYFFRDLQLNPDFPPEQFTRAALKP